MREGTECVCDVDADSQNKSPDAMASRFSCRVGSRGEIRDVADGTRWRSVAL